MNAETRLRAARLVAEHWRAEIMASDELRRTGMSHPVALVLAALDGETDPAELGIREDRYDWFRAALASAESGDEGPINPSCERCDVALRDHAPADHDFEWPPGSTIAAQPEPEPGLRLARHQPLIEGSAGIDGEPHLACSCGWDSADAAEDEPFMAHVAASCSPEPVPAVVSGVPGREPATALVGQGGPTGSGELAAARIASIPRLRLTGEQIDSIEPRPDTADDFAVDWDEYEDFLPWSALEAALAAPPQPAVEREGLDLGPTCHCSGACDDEAHPHHAALATQPSPERLREALAAEDWRAIEACLIASSDDPREPATYRRWYGDVLAKVRALATSGDQGDER